MAINYPRYELSVTISKRLTLDESQVLVQTTGGVPDITDRDALTLIAVDLVDFALFEGWEGVCNESS